MITHFHLNKGSLRTCEDSLTSTVFDLLKYLPTDIFWSILRRSLYHQSLPNISGEIQQFTYWPKWSAKGTTNDYYVEPDLFIRFEEFDLIIEAKRYNENQQNHNQISNEIQAYYNEYGDDGKDLYFIQLGGLLNLKEEELLFSGKESDKKLFLSKTDWTKLLDQIVLEKNKIDKIDYSQINSYKRIFADLMLGFEMHGFFRKLWLDSLNITFITSQSPNNLFNYASKY